MQAWDLGGLPLVAVFAPESESVESVELEGEAAAEMSEAHVRARMHHLRQRREILLLLHPLTFLHTLLSENHSSST